MLQQGSPELRRRPPTLRPSLSDTRVQKALTWLGIASLIFLVLSTEPGLAWTGAGALAGQAIRRAADQLTADAATLMTAVGALLAGLGSCLTGLAALLMIRSQRARRKRRR